MGSDDKLKQYTIRFDPDAYEHIKGMAREVHTSIAELIRRAINFYAFKLRVLREKKRIILEDAEGNQELILLERQVT